MWGTSQSARVCASLAAAQEGRQEGVGVTEVDRLPVQEPVLEPDHPEGLEHDWRGIGDAEFATEFGEALVAAGQDLGARRAEVGHLLHVEDDRPDPLAQEVVQRGGQVLGPLAVQPTGEAHDGPGTVAREDHLHGATAWRA